MYPNSLGGPCRQLILEEPIGYLADVKKSNRDRLIDYYWCATCVSYHCWEYIRCPARSLRRVD